MPHDTTAVGTTASSDPIMNLYYHGLTAREISTRVGRTRNAVLGYIWRYKCRGGPPMVIPAPKPKVPKTPRVRRILTKDPDTIKALEAINQSGITDDEVTHAVGLGRNTIQGWRRGRKGNPFLVQCVVDYVKNAPGY